MCLVPQQIEEDTEPKKVNNYDEQDEDSDHSSIQKVRDWVDRYEEAVTNHYSQELRARLSAVQVNGVHSDLKFSATLRSVEKCKTSLLSTGGKVSAKFYLFCVRRIRVCNSRFGFPCRSFWPLVAYPPISRSSSYEANICGRERRRSSRITFRIQRPTFFIINYQKMISKSAWTVGRTVTSPVLFDVRANRMRK